MSRIRQATILTFLLFFLSPLTLFARDYQMALIDMNGSNPSFMAFLERNAQGVLVSYEKDTPFDNAFAYEVAYNQKLLEIWKNRHEAYLKEEAGTYVQETIDIPKRIIADSPIKLTKVDASDKLCTIFSHGYYRWFCDAYDYDALLLVDCSKLSDYEHVIIRYYVRSSDTSSVIFDKISLESDYFGFQGELLLSLAKCVTDKSLGVLHFIDTPPSLYVSADDVARPLIDNLLLLPEGKHSLFLSAFGRIGQSKEIEVKSGQSLEVGASLQQIVFPPISLISHSGLVSWYKEGEVIGNNSAMTLQELQIPVLFQARKKGFVNQIVQLNESRSLISFDLRPSWLDDDKLLKDQQNEFYLSFRNLIFSIGLTLLYPTLFEVYGNSNVFTQALYVAAQGATGVFALHFLHDAIEYTHSVITTI
ncbi:MAG: hypothetical protein WCR02_03615 [Sphaerochaetaceae bacterium]